jgi:NAD(P)-dependent dehydrogenase (short-subunit alcohol dehydrogenase family)
MPSVLQNHIAAVTGAGSGIGRAIALGFAREGATVAALDIDGATAAKTSAGVRGAGGKAHVKRERMPAKIVRQLCLAASFRKRPSSDVLTRLSELLDEAL